MQPSYGLVQRAGTYEDNARSFEKSEQQKLETICDRRVMPWTARRRNENILQEASKRKLWSSAIGKRTHITHYEEERCKLGRYASLQQ